MRFPILILIVAVGFIPSGSQVNAQVPAAGAEGNSAPAYPSAPTLTRDEQGRTTLRATRLSGPLAIDGQLDESVYREVPPAGGFIQQDPLEGEAATEPTEAWIFFDDKNLYVAGRCYDSHPEKMVASELRRDSFNIYLNDNFAVVLDTFNDHRNAFVFYTNPIGGLYDGYVTDERDSNRDWNTVWESRSRRDEEGWTVEMAIPFKSLRYKPGNPQVWGINFRRIVRSKNEHSFLTAIPRSFGGRGIHKISSSATLTGLEVPERGISAEIKPYAIASVVTDRVNEPMVSNDFRPDGGADAKFALTQGLTADITFNTDFAQVENDEQQINLTRFSLFFPEKREFFLEGAGIFSFGGAGGRGRGGGDGGGNSLTPIIFYSRRIGINDDREVPILAGGRVTGKAGPYTIGVLNIQARDEPEANVLATNFSVVRLKRDILRRSSLGVIATSRSRLADGTEGSNQVFGFDANFAFYENLKLDAYLAKSWTTGYQGEDLSYRAAIDYSGDRYGLQLEQLGVGKNFITDIGFKRRDAFRRSNARARFSPRPKSISSIRRFNFEGQLDYITDTQGRLETRQQELQFGMEFNNSDRVEIEYSRTLEVLREEFELNDDVIVPEGAYNFQNIRLGYNLGPQRKFSGNLNASYGGFYGGTRKEAGVRSRFEISPRFSVEPGLSFNWINTPFGSYSPKLLNARINYALSPRMFLGALIQYNSNDDVVSTNIRFRWEYKPGSDFFVVYSEGRSTGLDGVPGLENRSFAVKFTRLFRF